MSEQIRESIIDGVRECLNSQLLGVEELIVNYTFSMFLYASNVYVQITGSKEIIYCKELFYFFQ